MAVQELHGKTLGEKHRHYNQLVKKAVEGDKTIQAGDFNTADDDVNNLIKIDVASKKRDLEYILNVLHCEDMLYVSRAIKKSTWLITERQYSHIINPLYLHAQLFPKMTSKACNKLMLHIRLHLKDADRVEDFYNFIKEKDTHAALKWLPNCSLPFIEKEVEKYHADINLNQLKRLCEKSITILEVYIKNCEYYEKSRLANAMFLLKNNTEKFLDICETLPNYQKPKYGPKATGILMKTCPQRILDKFDVYCDKLDLPTFAKHLKKEEIKDFIFKMSEKKEMRSWLKYDNLKHFVRYLPKEGRFDYLKKFFIDQSKNSDDGGSEDDIVPYAKCRRVMQCSAGMPVRSSANIYRWYRFAPFEVAFADLTKLIRAESAPAERIAMFGVLLSCAGRNMQHIQTVLQYYSDKHINEPFKFKIQFINMLLTKTDTFRLNETTWNTLNNIFHSMEVYIESENNVQTCIDAIILYKLLHNENVPENVENKFIFKTMKSVQTKLTEEEKEKVFSYLYKYLEKKITNKSINFEKELQETVQLLEDLLTLLMDWKKNLVDCPWFLEKLKEIINVKNSNSWKTNLSMIYHKNKSWRKNMFKESLLLSPSAETCYNVLKHDLELMSHNKGVVEELRHDDNISLRRVLRALRVYWPQSLAADWRAWYLARLDKPGGHKAVVQGLCTLAPQQQVIDIIKKYAPTESKINWGEDDEVVLSIRKHLARNMYVSRPLPPPEMVLLYAKGDYLQFALPSLNAVLHNMSAAQTREHLSKLLNAPVSLQKHGIRFAFSKLESTELKTVFHEIWKKAKNPSIRAVLFEQTYDLLCRQTKPTMIEEIWELLSIFIDNLSTDENKIIYDKLSKFDKVPLLVRGKFFMKSFKFLKSLPPKANCENTVNDLIYHMKDLMDHLDHEFVEGVLLESLDKKFTTARYQHSELMASYLLCAKDAESQKERYQKIILPVLERSFAIWDVKVNEGYFACGNVIDLLQQISKYFQIFVFEKRMVFPTQLFSDIQDQLEKRLPVEKNYQTQITWKLYTAYVRVLEEHKNMIDVVAATEDPNKRVDSNAYFYDQRTDKKWNDLYAKAIPQFSKICLEYLREDIKKYFPSIYFIFASGLKHALANIHQHVYLECLKSLLMDDEFISSYMVVLVNTPQHIFDGDETEKIVKEIREKIISNPSVEIKMHYYKKFKMIN